MNRVGVTFELRRDTAARWAAQNPVLNPAEPGFEMDTGLLKVGDGATPWLTLPYLIPSSQRGTANGVATLDATGHVPSSQVPGSGSSAIVQAFPTPAATWTKIHPFGRFANVGVLDSAGNIVDADIEQPDTATVVATFAAPTTGTLVLT